MSTEEKNKGKRLKGLKRLPPNKKKSGKLKLVLRGILIFFLLLIVGSGIFYFKKIRPIYMDYKAQMYEIIEDMGQGSFRRKGNTYIYDKDGAKIGKLGNEKYSYVESSKISDYIKKGYIAKEDRNFALHNGVDYKAILRAAIEYIKHKGRITQGGSTITQQVIKNNLLSQERSFKRKIVEAMTAQELEKTYSKAQIMEFYCNSNYYGSGCYGVEGAAEYYFGKTAKDVTLAEAAIIVGTSNRPNDYNPSVDYEKAMKKKASVLKSMLEEGYINKDEYEVALKERPKIVEQTDNTDSDNYMVSYAVHCATLELMRESGFEFKYGLTDKAEYEEYQEKYKKAYSSMSAVIRNGGYKIYTSFDQQLQSRLQEAVTSHLDNKLQGAAVCIDNKTQMVVAIVGGKKRSDEYNRAFLMERNPGSSIKPLLVYGPALNDGTITAGKIMQDQEIDINGYSPSNADGQYRGDVTVRQALAESINTIAVQILSENGIKDSFPYLRKMRFSSLSPADPTMLSTALGGFTNGVKIIDMAKGYAAIANGGKYSENTCLVRLEMEDGTNLFKVTDEEKEIYNKDTAYILTDLMQGTFRWKHGTAHDLYNESKIYAGKTGTTNNNKDAWFCGFSTDYTCAVWTGRDKPKSIENLKGSTYPLYIWLSFMDGITPEKKDFPIPETVYLENDMGEENHSVEITDDMFASRPKGFDYMSELTKEKLQKKERDARIKEEKKAADDAVDKFEKFQITSIEEAQSLDERHQNVLNVIKQIEDEEEQKGYLERTAYKYNLLSGEVTSKWKEVIEQEEKNKQAKKDLENQKKAAKSEETAREELNQRKIDVVEWYIDALEDRTVYSEAVKEMILDAREALKECENLKRYDELNEDLEKAISKAQNQPTREELEQRKKQITMPTENDYPETYNPNSSYGTTQQTQTTTIAQ